MTAADTDGMLLLVQAQLLSAFGQDSGRADVSFVGTPRIDVLRFGPDPDELVRYATLGMSRQPMADPGASLVAAHGPRAELVLTVRGLQDSVLRRLAVLAASPAVEGLVLGPGAALDLGEPLWDGAPFTAVLLGEPGAASATGVADVPDLEWRAGEEPVRFLPILPMTPHEAAYKRAHGAAALLEQWRAHGTDLYAPRRRPVPLAPPTLDRPASDRPGRAAG